MYAFGAIVLARFPFSDLSGDKRRPALVVSRTDPRATEIVVRFITSARRIRPGTALLDPGGDTGLKLRSVVHFRKLASLHLSVIAGELGTAPPAWLDAHAKGFHAVFGFRPPA